MQAQPNKRPRHRPTGTSGIYYSINAGGKKVFEVRVTGPDGKRQYKKVGSNFAQAKARLHELQHSVDQGAPIASGTATVSDLVDEWLAVLHTRNKAPRTVESYTGHAERIRRDLGKVKARDLTARQIQLWLHSIDLAGGTKALLLTVLAQILQRAVTDRVLASNPAKQLDPDAKPKQNARPEWRILQDGDLDRLIAAAQGRLAWIVPIILVTLYQGLRMGEVLALDWEHIDFTNNTLTVAGSLGRDGVVGQTKGKDSRTIDLLPQTRKVLLGLLEEQGIGATGPIFRSHASWGGHRRQIKTLSGAWEKVRDRAGLGETPDQRALHFHDLRHSVATVLLNTPGNTPVEVQNFLGHEQFKTTEKYSHGKRDEKRAERFGSAVNF